MNRAHKIWQLSYWSQTWAGMPATQRKLFGYVMLVHFILTALYTFRQGILFDEPDYFSYVVNWAKGHPERVFPIMDSKTPMVALSLISAVLKPFLPKNLLVQDVLIYLKAGRYFMYGYQLLGGFTILCWLTRLAGPGNWLLPLLFYCFDPLVFSFGMVIGSDLASAALLVTAMYSAWRFTVTQNRRYWFMLSIAAALAIVTKASMIYCYPLLALLLVFSRNKNKRINYKQVLLQLLSFVIIQLLIINLAYYFRGSFTAFGHIHFTSRLLSGLQTSLRFFGPLPVPLPAAFIQGFDMLQQHAEFGGCKPESTYWGVWIFNTVYCDKSVWFYYLAAALFKFPLLIWLMIVALLVRFFAASNKAIQLREKLFIWVPIIYFLLILSLFNKFQIGIRHAMIVMPFLYIGLSDTINVFYNKYKAIFCVLLFLHIVSVARYFPNIIAYTNELVWNKTKAYKIFKDSSLDYGQSNQWAKDFIEENKNYKKPTNLPDTGRFAIPVGDLFSEEEGSLKNIAWLRENFEPVGNYRYTILLFHISAEDLKAKGLVAK